MAVEAASGVEPVLELPALRLLLRLRRPKRQEWQLQRRD